MFKIVSACSFPLILIVIHNFAKELRSVWYLLSEQCSDLKTSCKYITGLTSRIFKGIPSLHEVECTGRNLKPEVKLLALQMYTLPDHVLLATLNVISNTCVTLGEMASCVVNKTNSHKSKLRILVSDLEEEDRRQYKCTGNTLDSYGLSEVITWELTVTRHSKYKLTRMFCKEFELWSEYFPLTGVP